MNKRMRELLAEIDTKTNMAKAFMDGEDKNVDKATELMDQVDALRKEYEAEERIYNSEKAVNAQNTSPVEPVEAPKAVEEESELTKFAKAFRGMAQGKSLVEGTDANGGYTVPEDITTLVNKYKDVDYNLEQDITVENVTTNKGARTYQKKGEVSVFVDIDENGPISDEIEAPTFERVSYAIQDRAGFMPVSNDLIADSDANIAQVVAEWLGKADVATTNKNVLAKVAEKEATDLKDLSGIKKAVNVTLGQAYKVGSQIITNDDGLNYLDTLEDANGRPLLNPDPTAPQTLTLRCGTTVLPIKVLPNKVLKTNATKVPFIIGSLGDYVKKFDRQHMTIDASTTATLGSFNAFAKNMTLMRAILRDDYKVIDKDSIVNGYITLGE